jgi:hypothetical protein
VIVDGESQVDVVNWVMALVLRARQRSRIAICNPQSTIANQQSPIDNANQQSPIHNQPIRNLQPAIRNGFTPIQSSTAALS